MPRRGAICLAIGLVAGLLPSAPPARAQAEPPAGHWVAGDLHIHTTYSHDSYGGPDDHDTGPEEFYTLGHTVASQFAIAAARGLDYLAITDHNDIRSQEEFDQAGDVLPIAGYENSLSGHAQMLGAHKIYDMDPIKTDPPKTADDINGMAKELRLDGGVFQINHPKDGEGGPDWGYGFDVVPDTIEVWNISRIWQGPAPSASSNDDAVAYWQEWLDRGHRIGATAGSDNHWVSTTAVQGAGQPTTWVYVTEESEEGLLEGLRAGHTFISHQPPNHGGPRIFLEGDGNGDGTFEAIVGDDVPPGSQLRVRVEGAPGSLLSVVTDEGTQVGDLVPVTSPAFEHRFTVPATSTWVRAEIIEPDGEVEREENCDPEFGDQTTYCRNQIAVLGMTSALYLEESDPDPTPTPTSSATTIPTPTGSPSPSASATGEPGETVHTFGTNYARVSADRLVLGNDLVERRWQLAAFKTTALRDKRAGGHDWAGSGADFRLDLGPTELDSSLFNATGVTVEEIDGERGPGLRARVELSAPGVSATRVVDVYDGVAGFRTRTILTPTAALPLFGYTLDEAVVGAGVKPTIHAFRAGADWRDPVNGWEGPTPHESWPFEPASVGDWHPGTWRETHSADAGVALAGPAQWISLADGQRSAFLVMERNDQPSSRASYDGSTASLDVDLTRDIVVLGPFEENVHAENPTPAKARHRVIKPGQSLALESAFIGFGSHDGDEAWQFHKYLVEHRLQPYAHDVTFNSNGTDGNIISTGAKDDMNFATVQQVADKARALGIDTFILDDGWQANSGDWIPDCPGHRDYRLRYDPRFPDCDFTAVREAIAPMKLGLWMSPMHFNPQGSETFKAHPEWACWPINGALSAYNIAQPDSSSNEAGLGMWGPDAIPHIESRIRVAIEEWGVTFFKFDFLAWVDCAGQGDLYDYREAFVGMLDRLGADYPNVTLQTDETNDYRLFPFESVARGPSWFQNGSPKTNHLLHNIWNLSPYVPSFSLGQHFLGGSDPSPIDTRMAASLLSYPTFFSDLRNLSHDTIAAARPWIDFYKANQEVLGHAVYPLLSDPVENGWTALQSWDPEAGEGALLAFRQESNDASRTIALENVPAGQRFDLFAAPTGERVGRVTSEQLSNGIEVTIPEKKGAQVLVIRPATTLLSELAFTPTSATSGRYSDQVTFAAALTDELGAPLPGESIDFTLTSAPGPTTFSAITGPNGIASATVTLTGDPGMANISAHYAGRPDEVEASSAVAPFVIEKELTKLKLVVPTKSAVVIITATLTDDEGIPIAGRPIVFTNSKGPICPGATTDAKGRASCWARRSDISPPFRARFDGDARFVASSAS